MEKSQQLLTESHEQVFYITLNRVDKHNAFDEHLLYELQNALDTAEKDEKIRIIVLKANGPDFSAGADLNWMKRMASLTEADNIKDAEILARALYSLYASTKLTLSIVQGCAFGGGAGLVAASDIAIAAHSARFCFSEVKLGLIPAVIAPYVIEAMGTRTTNALFMSAEPFNATQALHFKLIQHCIPDEEMDIFPKAYIKRLLTLAPEAVKASKQWGRFVADKPIDQHLILESARKIAKQRVSDEGQQGLQAFLNKTTPPWNLGD